jgi:hypothetical protein
MPRMSKRQQRLRRKDRLIFYLHSAPVGVFYGRSYPTAAGRVRYVPYRGPGHMHMALALKRGEKPRCWYVRRRKRFEFIVRRETFVPGEVGECSNWFVYISKPLEIAKPNDT